MIRRFTFREVPIRLTNELHVRNEKHLRVDEDGNILLVIGNLELLTYSKERNEFTPAWMMKGMNNAEITGWLRAVQENAPEQVFNTLFTIAEKELPYQRFRKILEDLTEGAMVA